MFNLYDNDRLTAWKQFRDSLEVSDTPFGDVAMLWSRAPFVSPYLDPQNPSEWPDPWHLVLDSRLDNLAIALGMLYTIKLTQRFMNVKCEIHTSTLPNEKEPSFLLIVDGEHVLNFEYGCAVNIKDLNGIRTSLIWTK